MPKSTVGSEERKRAEFEKERDKQIKYITGVFAATKYRIPEYEITSKMKKGSKTIVNKVRRTPEKATILQLFEVAYSSGMKVTITVE